MDFFEPSGSRSDTIFHHITHHTYRNKQVKRYKHMNHMPAKGISYFKSYSELLTLVKSKTFQGFKRKM